MRAFSSGTALLVAGAAAAASLAALVELPGTTGSILQRVAVLAGLAWIAALALRIVVAPLRRVPATVPVRRSSRPG